MGAAQSRLNSRILAIEKDIEARMYGADAQTDEARRWEADRRREIAALKAKAGGAPPPKPSPGTKATTS